MRTTLDIDEVLLKTVMDMSHVSTKKDAINLSLEAFIRQKRLERLARRLGKGGHRLTHQDLKIMRSK